MSDERLERIENGLVEVKGEVRELRDNIAELQIGQIQIERRLVRVEIGQEEMRDQIQLIAEGHAATQATMARGVDEIKEHIDRRIDPIERAVRHFARAP